MITFLTTFQNPAANFQQKQLKGNLRTLLGTIDGCLATFEKKHQLVQEVLDRVRQHDGGYESLVIEPVPGLFKGFAGDTAYGTLMKMIEEKKTLLQQPDEGDADEEQSGDDGRVVDEEQGENNGGGST